MDFEIDENKPFVASLKRWKLKLRLERWIKDVKNK